MQLHVVHNGFSKGLAVYGEEAEELASDLYSFFHSAARREDFAKFQALFEVEEKFFQRHTKTRWLTLVPVVERILELLDALEKFISTLNEKDIVGKKRFIRVRNKLKSPETKIQLYFLQSVGPIFTDFLTLFQTKGPLVHILQPRLLELVKTLLFRFLKRDHVEGKSARQLIELDLKESTIQLEDADHNVGSATSVQLSKLKSEQRRQILLRMRHFYQEVVGYLLSNLPLNKRTLKDLTRRDESSHTSIQRLARQFAFVLRNEVEVTMVADEWKAYQTEPSNGIFSDDTCSEFDRKPVDGFWRLVEDVKKSDGSPKYVYLMKVVKAALLLSHGNSQVERGFSVNKRTLHDRASMNPVTLFGLRVVKDHMNSHGLKAHQLEITTDLLIAGRGAYSAYKLRLDQETEKAKKAEERTKEHMDKDVAEAEKTKKGLTERDDEISKKLKNAMFEMKVSEKLLKESNEKLAAAIKAKDFSQVAVAHSMMDSASSKMSDAKQEIAKLQKDKESVDTRKRKLLNQLIGEKSKKAKTGTSSEKK